MTYVPKSQREKMRVRIPEKLRGSKVKVITAVEIPSFDVAFLSKVREAFIKQEARVYDTHLGIEATPGGVIILKAGVEPIQFIPDIIINRMVYDVKKQAYRVVPI